MWRTYPSKQQWAWMSSRTVAITGHRPEKITNEVWVKRQMKDALTTFVMPSYLIQGMAAGVDLWSAVIARQLGVMYECAKPWAGHLPRKADAKLYQDALHFADKVTNVDPSENYPGPWVYQKRNKYMVDHADTVLAVWDGSKGGTGNCVQYALELSRPIYRIDPVKLKWGWYANSPI
jgi:uncharacterized phage-like protein YoqJ